MRSIFSRAMVLVGLIVLLFGGAMAQSQPAAQNPADDARMRSSPVDAYRGYNDYPAAEVLAIPAARANAVRARLEMELIQTNMHRWIDRAWDDFMNTKDYLDAADAEKKAQDDYARERQRALKRLTDDSSYRALASLVADLKDKIETERAKSKPLVGNDQDAMDNMMAMATLKMSYASALSAMETSVLATDDGVKNAMARLHDAAAKTRVMRHGFDRNIRHDPDFLAARVRYDEAKINHVVSSVYLDSAINARDIALDYAVYVHRWDQYKYSTPAYSDPYGYGAYNVGYTRRY